MPRLSNLGAFVAVAGVLVGGLMALNEALATTDPADGTQPQFDSVEELLGGGAELFGPLIVLLAALAVVAVISGRL